MNTFTYCGIRKLFIIGLAILSVTLAGCQSAGGLNGLLNRSAQAARPDSQPPAASPTLAAPATPTSTSVPRTPATPIPPMAPAPVGTPRAPSSAVDAASRIIPVPKAGLPRGPRKPPPNRLIIPSIGVDTKVIELATYYNEEGELLWETAPFAAGHHIGTANPGEPGNVVISGHISSIREGAVFKRLPEIEINAGVVLVTNDRNYLYRVVDKRIVEPTQVEVMFSTSEETLTLITCVPDGVYTQRLIVTARRI